MSLCAGVFVALLATSLVVDQSVRLRLQNLDDTQSLFAEAIVQTKEDLLIKVGEVTRDSTIPQHLTWGLAHSVRSTLESHIASGKLDQVTLWTKGGTETGRARDVDVKRPFEPGSEDKTLDRWTWAQEGATPELLLVRPLMGSTPNIYVAGSVTLGKSWLNRFSDLQKKLDQFDLRIVQASSDGIPISLTQPDMHAPKLISLRPSDGWILSAHRVLGSHMLPSVWPTLILAVACALMALRQKTTRLASLQKETLSHLAWCEELSGESIGRDDHREKAFGAALARRHIDRAMAQKNTAHHQLEETILQLQTKIERLEDDLKRRQKHLLSIAPFYSMAVQIIALIDPFLGQLEDFQRCTLGTSTTLRDKVAVSARHLNHMMQRWKADIESRGSRKFIRSLAETAGQEPGSTALDDEIALIEKTSVDLLCTGEKSIASLSQLAEKASALRACAEQWDAIKDQSLAPQVAAHPLDVLNEAQTMLITMLESQGETMNFQLHPASGPQPMLPPSPRQVWVAGLFHLMQAFHLYRAETPCKLSLRMRQHGNRGLLVMQSRKTESPTVQNTEQGLTPLDLIELARTLLSPYGGSLQLLPQKDVGVMAIAIGWPLAAEPLKKGDRIAAGHPHEGHRSETMFQ